MKRCEHCGKRIFFDDSTKYSGHYTWRHYGYARRECEPPLKAKYATPKEEK